MQAYLCSRFTSARFETMIETDIIIIGAGPCGLFTVFEAGLLKLKCHLIDALPQPGGQLSEIYPKKPIYDIPGFPSVLAKDLVDNLIEQAAPFNPEFTLGDRAEHLDRMDDGRWKVTTLRGVEHAAPIVMIAGGLGSFEPRKPPISNITDYEDHGVEYMVRDPDLYKGKRMVIAGGGDSALDWTIFLSKVAAEVTLVHRRSKFRGALDSVEKVKMLADDGKIKLITEAQVTGIQGDGHVQSVTITPKAGNPYQIETDHFVPLFGLTPKLGPLDNWGLEIEKGAIRVDTIDYRTNLPGVFAIGDINTYTGKLKLILCGFHEGTMAVQSAYKIIFPDKKHTLKYTTVTGVQGFQEA